MGPHRVPRAVADDPALAYLLAGWDPASGVSAERFLRDTYGIALYLDHRPRHIAGQPAQLLSFDRLAEKVPLDAVATAPIVPVDGKRRRRSRKRR